MSDKNNVLIDTEKRIFYLSDDIEVSTISQLNFQLIKILEEDDRQEKEKKEYERKPIHLIINSFGGNVYDMWSLIDILLNSKTPIHTYCTGYAMSAGFLIFLAGEKRSATPHATFVYHQTSDWLGKKKFQDLVEYQEEAEFAQLEMEKYIIERTNITKEKLEEIRLHKKDWYIHLDEALELNIVNNLIK